MPTIPRFHPLVQDRDGVATWFICDGHADTEHSLAVPYVEAPDPCMSREEALDLCAILDEECEQQS